MAKRTTTTITTKRKKIRRPRVTPWADLPKAEDPKRASRFQGQAEQVRQELGKAREAIGRAGKAVGKQWKRFEDWSNKRDETSVKEATSNRRTKKGPKKPTKGGMFDIDPSQW